MNEKIEYYGLGIATGILIFALILGYFVQRGTL